MSDTEEWVGIWLNRKRVLEHSKAALDMSWDELDTNVDHLAGSRREECGETMRQYFERIETRMIYARERWLRLVDSGRFKALQATVEKVVQAIRDKKERHSRKMARLARARQAGEE